MPKIRKRKLLPDGTYGPLESMDGSPSPEEKAGQLETENKLLKAQNQAISERADFMEDLIAEIAMKVYQ